MRKKLVNLKKLLLKQAEECQQRMLAADSKDSWESGYNHGAKDCIIMMVNSLNNILKNGDN